MIFLEKQQPFCLACADMDHLEFLPSGDTALTRRTKKYSSLTAVVVRFNRSRKHYERQGILATLKAIAQAIPRLSRSIALPRYEQSCRSPYRRFYLSLNPRQSG